MLPTTAVANDVSALNRNLVKRYLIPRYQELADRAAEANDALSVLCESPDEQRLTAARQSYHGVADAWSAVDQLTLGPISTDFRADRFNHWPGRRNAVGKAVAKVLSSTKPDALQPQQFVKTSVALQGLAALERLLFAGPETLDQLREPASSGVSRCALIAAIGTNLRSISAALIDEWQDQSLLTALSDNNGRTRYFTSAQNAGQILLSDFLAIPHKVAYLNLGRVLGSEPDHARPKLAEQWRSGRAARSIVVSLQSAFDIYKSGFSELIAASDGSNDEQLQQLFSAALSAARELPDDFVGSVDSETERPRFETALATVTELRDRLREEVPRSIGLQGGFTSFDGD